MTNKEKAAQLCCKGVHQFIKDGKYDPKLANKLITICIGRTQLTHENFYVLTVISTQI